MTTCQRCLATHLSAMSRDTTDEGSFRAVAQTAEA